MNAANIPNGQPEVPKDNNSQVTSTSPPPAYTPPQTIRSALRSLANVVPLPDGSGREVGSVTFIGQDDGDEEDAEPLSPISLRINTSVNVTKSDNLVCLPSTPAANANAIAKAVVHAIQQSSSGQCGIPMIDEDGRPRPVNIEVDAGIVVDGDGNIVGDEKMVHKVLIQRGILPRKRSEDSGSSSSSCDTQDNTSHSAKRRRCSQ